MYHRYILVAALVLLSCTWAMQFTTLGTSSLKVSKVCLGTMTWGQQNTEAEGIDQLNVAFKEYGINFLDTAEMYPVPTKAETQGRTDLIIAKWLKQQSRDKVILATKVSGPGIAYLPGRNGQNSRVRPADITASVDASLQRLGTDYVDLLQIHWPDRYVPIFGQTVYNRSLERDYESFESTLQCLHDLVVAGKVRALGLSNESPYGVMKFAQAAEKLGLTKFATLQNSYSLINRVEFDATMNEVCSPRHENIALLPYSPLAGGILTGKYAPGSGTSDDVLNKSRLNMFPGYMARYKQSLAVTAVEKYSKYAKEIGMSTAALALGWCYKQPYVASTIIGATSVAQLRENIEAYSEENMARIDCERIDTIHKECRDPSKI